MDIIEKVTITQDKKVGYQCDMCHEEHREVCDYGRAKIHQTLDDGCDGFYQQWADLCLICSQKVWKFIAEQGGRINSDY